MNSIVLPGLSFGGVSRPDWTAADRSRYQLGHSRFEGEGKQEHFKQWLMLPSHVDARKWTRETIWDEAGAAERRKDAREARYLDVLWPRQMPLELVDEFVDALYGPFVDKFGLVVQVDLQRAGASDGGDNDHLHGMISTRRLTNVGFAAKKCRELDKWFLNDERPRVCEIFNRLAQKYEIAIQFDPRPNTLRDGALPPQVYLSKALLFRGPETPARKHALERKDQQRAVRQRHTELSKQIAVLRVRLVEAGQEFDDGFERMWILNGSQPVPRLSLETIMFELMSSGIEVDDQVMTKQGPLIVVDGTAIIDWGERILVGGRPDGATLDALQVISRSKGWRWNDLSVTDDVGMPQPLPLGVPKDENVPLPDYAVVGAARELFAELRNRREAERIAARIDKSDNPALKLFIHKLDALVEHNPSYEITVEDVGWWMKQALSGNDSIWHRYALGQDIALATVPGSSTARPFRPRVRPILDHRPDTGTMGQA